MVLVPAALKLTAASATSRFHIAQAAVEENVAAVDDIESHVSADGQAADPEARNAVGCAVEGDSAYRRVQTISSPVPGTTLFCQLLAVPQSPPAALVQKPC